ELASLLARAEQEEEAIAALRDVIRRDPKHRHARKLLAQVLEKRDDFEGALRVLRDAAPLWRWDLDIIQSLTRIHRKLGDVASAADAWDSAVEALRSGARPDAAELDYEVDSQDAAYAMWDVLGPFILNEAILQRGHALLLAARNEEALAAYDDAIRGLQATSTTRSVIPPGSLHSVEDVHLFRAMALRRLGRATEARVAFDAAMAPHAGGAIEGEEFLKLLWVTGVDLVSPWRALWLACWPDATDEDLARAAEAVERLQRAQGEPGTDQAESAGPGAAVPSLAVADMFRLAMQYLIDCASGAVRLHSGDLEGAVDALERAVAVLGEVDADLSSADMGIATKLHLAMALHRLGREEEARTYYEDALRWQDAQQSHDPLVLFHFEEARGVFEIDDHR
ncbi:MAG: tetratricopeptide repeat protein, partial [Planctomycetota bacterium]